MSCKRCASVRVEGRHELATALVVLEGHELAITLVALVHPTRMSPSTPQLSDRRADTELLHIWCVCRVRAHLVRQFHCLVNVGNGKYLSESKRASAVDVNSKDCEWRAHAPVRRTHARTCVSHSAAASHASTDSSSHISRPSQILAKTNRTKVLHCISVLALVHSNIGQ